MKYSCILVIVLMGCGSSFKLDPNATLLVSTNGKPISQLPPEENGEQEEIINSESCEARIKNPHIGQNLNDVQVVAPSADIRGWNIRSNIDRVEVNSSQICIYHSMLGAWPEEEMFDWGRIVEGKYWVIANVGGTWRMGTYD